MPADAAAEHGYIRGVMPAPETDGPPGGPNDIRRKRLLFRAWHRGTREADLILGSFAEKYLAGFDETQLTDCAALLDVSDADLVDWICGRVAPPPEHDTDVSRLLLAFRYCPPT